MSADKILRQIRALLVSITGLLSVIALAQLRVFSDSPLGTITMGFVIVVCATLALAVSLDSNRK